MSKVESSLKDLNAKLQNARKKLQELLKKIEIIELGLETGIKRVANLESETLFSDLPLRVHTVHRSM